MPKAALFMGSKSDFASLEGCVRVLKSFGIETTVRVASAHRTPQAVAEFAACARTNGYEVILAAAGKAAHLAGVIAGHTTLPVIGIPVKSSFMDGLDSLLSTVQMPTGIPVATVAVGGGDNAAYLCAQILSIKYPEIAQQLAEHREQMAAGIARDDAAVAEQARAL
ncbi:MAG TPA: 5-(carboxyamino)imidazole ribonucleotide mutase [Candidatus Onthenecus intestinigallinarum]|uniref:N5-carboxyaminoimidazole ribonucleotide mutase n=1 Tax=Candidatus Onthenecus intestinigallinarum TaxID=2840875 RepID=A0A9D1CR89_9FIRM|nr:5-(carboxyamino)imidazole ribonucleotide mutase [Candidatus Onthenecus intestinigallinarum]